MTTAEQSLLVVLNRGGANQIQTTYERLSLEIQQCLVAHFVLADSVQFLLIQETSLKNQTNSGNGSTDPMEIQPQVTTQESQQTIQQRKIKPSKKKCKPVMVAVEILSRFQFQNLSNGLLCTL